MLYMHTHTQIHIILKHMYTNKYTLKTRHTCVAYSTGYPSSSVSYSLLLLWSGGVSWALLRPSCEIFPVPTRAPEAAAPSTLRSRGYSLRLLLRASTRQTRAYSAVGPFAWNELPGHFYCSPEFILTLSILTFYSSLKTVLCSRARIGGASE